MNNQQFHWQALNFGASGLVHRDRTIAYVTRQGYIDWLLPGEGDDGPRLRRLEKEPHLSHALGLLFRLHFPGLAQSMTRLETTLTSAGEAAVVTAECADEAGNFVGRHQATLVIDPDSQRYQWQLLTTLTCTAKSPVARDWIEFNNVYPMGTGRCMLFEPQKRFQRTLMRDVNGDVWDFPHQHTLHYSGKISALTFAPGTVAGFFDEPLNPVVEVHECTLPPDWAICDMYYDLHCGARVAEPLTPGSEHRFQYTIRYLDHAEARPLTAAAQLIPIAADDYARHDWPRLTLGRNCFAECAHIDEADDASCFRTRPPALVWDRTTGPPNCGSLRLQNDADAELVWSATPPSQIPAQRVFRLSALARTRDVVGRGVFLRVRYHTFVWHPQPHVEWVETLESNAVSGTSDEWLRLALPALTVPAAHFDYLVWVDVVLAGSGTAWVTDAGVHLDEVPVTAPGPPVPVR